MNCFVVSLDYCFNLAKLAIKTPKTARDVAGLVEGYAQA